VSQITPRGLLLHATFGEMYNIRALSEILMQMPLAADKLEAMAGPPFQVPYTLKLPVDPTDRWRCNLDVLRTGVELGEYLLKFPDQRHRRYLLAMIEADRQLITMIKTILSWRPATEPAVKTH
jgi:hypothetical protein